MKAFIVIKQIYEEVDVIGACLSSEGADKIIEEERVKHEKDYPGCWEYGFWENVQDWADGGKFKQMRNGDAVKRWYRIEECELEK